MISLQQFMLKNFLHQVHDNGFTLSGGGSIKFSMGGEIGDPWIYWQTPLLGNRFSYDIDVSNVGCHCNAAAYFSQLPGYNSNQQPEPGPGYYLVSTLSFCSTLPNML
jgi:hypothetical protein